MKEHNNKEYPTDEGGSLYRVNTVNKMIIKHIQKIINLI